MAKLTIIVPYDGEADSLEETLVSLLENRPAECEIMVVLNIPYENTYDLCEDEVCFVPNPDASRSFESAVHMAVNRSASEIVHIVPCGCLVGSGWADAAMALFEEEKVTCVIPLLHKPHLETPAVIVSRELPQRVPVLTQGFRLAVTGDLLPIAETAFQKTCEKMSEEEHVPHPFGVFFRRCAYLAAGGLDLSFGGTLAVVDLALRTRENGGRIVATADSALTVPGRMLYPDGPEKTRRQVKRLFWRWNFGKRPLLGMKTLLAKWIFQQGRHPSLNYESQNH